MAQHVVHLNDLLWTTGVELSATMVLSVGKLTFWIHAFNHHGHAEAVAGRTCRTACCSEVELMPASQHQQLGQEALMMARTQHSKDVSRREQQPAAYHELHGDVVLVGGAVHLHTGPDGHWRHCHVRHNEVLRPPSNVQHVQVIITDLHSVLMHHAAFRVRMDGTAWIIGKAKHTRMLICGMQSVLTGRFSVWQVWLICQWQEYMH